MKKVIGLILIILGVLSLAGAGIRAANAPNASYLIGTFFPGLLLLIIGLLLRQEKKRPRGK
jgi:lipopolysaccharide export LptBFGC system permease protein LptF